MVTACKNVCRGLDLFTRRSTKESYASKGYCDTAGYFTLFCMQNNQNLKYWAYYSDTSKCSTGMMP